MDLPKELIITILEELSFEAVISCSLVSKLFNECSNNDGIWQKLFKPYYRQFTGKHKRDYQSNYFLEHKGKNNFNTYNHDKSKDIDIISKVLSISYIYIDNHLDYLQELDKFYKLEQYYFYGQNNQITQEDLYEILTKLKHLPKLESMLIKKTNLTIFPINIQTLKCLFLHKNKIEMIPKEIFQLGKLEHLNLSNNSISNIPAEISQLVTIKKLNLSSNSISSIPVEIGKLVHLESLCLSNNSISSIPAEIGKLINLETLYLSNNSISSIPAEICQLVNLGFLYLSNNSISSIPVEINKLVNLVSLDLSNNSFDYFDFSKCNNVKELNLSNNKLKTISSTINIMIQLTILNLSNNILESLPNELGKLTNLVCLILENNNLQEFSIQFLSDNNLKHLDIRNNKLKTIGSNINNLKKLRCLLLDHNNISVISDDAKIAGTDFDTISLSFNELTYIPKKFITRINVSENVILNNNKLAEFPKNVYNSGLSILNLLNNNFKTVPKKIKPIINTARSAPILYLDNDVEFV